MEKSKRIAVLPDKREWLNVELIKDCGLIPYLLYKNHNCNVSLVGARGDDYTYLETHVKGLKMEFLSNGNDEERVGYISENAKDIDCLVLRGCYPINFVPANLYKKLNPNGRVYVGLDANSHWMDRIIWTDADFMEFMGNCDVIATSCKTMQRHLNEKWPWVIEHIPNGYYNFDYSIPPQFEEKENVILTVGRLGADRKATNILMESFAAIAEEIPDWNLRLTGSIEEDFNDFITLYFETYPQLKGRVQLTGPITNREELAKQYREAKVFALPSVLEGGTPNVISEALNAGCVLALTKIDAYNQAIDYGKCGLASEINDIKGFANILLTLCKSKNLSVLSKHAYKYGQKNFDMEKITAKLYYMIFGGRD